MLSIVILAAGLSGRALKIAGLLIAAALSLAMSCAMTVTMRGLYRYFDADGIPSERSEDDKNRH